MEKVWTKEELMGELDRELLKEIERLEREFTLSPEAKEMADALRERIKRGHIFDLDA